MDLKRQNYLIVFGQFLTKPATVSCCARWDFSSLSRKRLLRAWSFETLIPAAATVYSLSRHSGFIWFLLRSFKLVDMYFKLFRPTLKTWQFYDKEDDIFQTKRYFWLITLIKVMLLKLSVFCYQVLDKPYHIFDMWLLSPSK